MKLLVVCVLCLSFKLTFGQLVEKKPHKVVQFHGVKWKPAFSLLRYHSGFRRSSPTFNGFRVGMEYKSKLRFGLLFLGHDAPVDFETFADGGRRSLAHAFSAGGGVEVLIINNYRWELGVPYLIGVGEGLVEWYGLDDRVILRQDKESFAYHQLGVRGQYNINYWLGVNVGIGYRVGVSPNEELRNFVQSYYTSYGFRIRPSHLLKSIFHHKELVKYKQAFFQGERLKLWGNE